MKRPGKWWQVSIHQLWVQIYLAYNLKLIMKLYHYMKTHYEAHRYQISLEQIHLAKQVNFVQNLSVLKDRINGIGLNVLGLTNLESLRMKLCYIHGRSHVPLPHVERRTI